MKGKFRKILGVGLALALVLSFSLVAAVPAAADSPADTDVGFEFGKGTSDTVEWSTDEAGVDNAMGDYSVSLDNQAGEGDTYVQFIPAAGTTFADFQADIAGAGDKWSFWDYKVTIAGTPNWAQFELKFTDPASSDFFDIMFTQHNQAAEAKWLEVIVDKDVVAFQYWGPDLGYSGALVDFATLLGLSTDKLDGATYEPYQLTRVRVELYEPQIRATYIDDITIEGVTYELEPIFLDAEYYSVGDTVVVTVPNFFANTDPIRVNPVTSDLTGDPTPTDWQVTVISDSDSEGITVALEETGINTGVFTGSFTTTSTTPAEEDELYVQDDDTFTVAYDVAVAWGTDVVQTTPLTLAASVDDTAPTITTLTPGDGDQIIDTMPPIGASYSDVPNISDIDEDSVEIIVNGVDVTDDDATTVGSSSVTYTPTEDLADGTHDVTVNVSDNAGNEATETWSFRVVSWLEGPLTETGSVDLPNDVDVGVSAGDGSTITVGRFASNPEPDAPPTFSLIENGFFDVKVLDADTTQVVIKFADPEITAESTAYVWDNIEGAWLECSDQGYNSVAEYLWVKVRADTTPSIAELTGTPFAISGEEEVDILAYYRGADGIVSTSELLTGITDWAAGTIPSGFTEALTTTQLLTLITEWAS